MQPALKTRLIGAFVLIALAVIVVPLFFSGEPSGGGGQNISLAIPPTPDAQLKTRTLSVAPPGTSAIAPAVAVSPAAHGGLATVNIPSRVPPAVTPAASIALPVASTPSPPSPVATGKGGPTTPSATRGAPASAPPPTAPEPGRAANDHYLVSLGAYTHKANAQQLVARVAKLGYKAKVSGVDVGGIPAARVDVGPFASRSAAEAARLKLHAALPQAPAKLISAPTDQAGNAPANALPRGRAGGWAVQLVAFDARKDADHLRDRLRQAGFAGYVDDVVAGHNTLWRVRVGPFAQRSDALALIPRIKSQFPRFKGVVVTVP